MHLKLSRPQCVNLAHLQLGRRFVITSHSFLRVVISHPHANFNDILTHSGQDKMDAISQMTFSTGIFLNENV